MMALDTRWLQRFTNFESALTELKNDISIMHSRSFNTLEEKGLIKTFEFTFELAWNCFKDIGVDQGCTDILGSKDAIRFAFKNNIIHDGELWMSMVDSRIKTSHTCNRAVAKDITQKIITLYYPEFMQLHVTLMQLKNKQS